MRRKCRNVSLTSPEFVIRGFELRPSSVNFGALQEGTSSAVIVRLKNVGVDTCRYYNKGAGVLWVTSKSPVTFI